MMRGAFAPLCRQNPRRHGGDLRRKFEELRAEVELQQEVAGALERAMKHRDWDAPKKTRLEQFSHFTRQRPAIENILWSTRRNKAMARWRGLAPREGAG